MKNTKKCPKCGANVIFLIRENAHSAIPTSIFSSVGIYRYICGKCGYTEEWVDEEGLQKLYDNLSSQIIE